jgi:hypothetical protein
VEQLVGVDALLAAAEVRRGRTPADELDRHVQLIPMDVPKKTAVAISVVEVRIGFEHDLRSRGRESLELAPRLACVALVLSQLGSVDLDESHPGPVAKVERVAVADPRDRRARTFPLPGLVGAARKRDSERENDE